MEQIPLYRNKDWLFNQMITLGKTELQVAEENGWTKRVVAKWVEIFGFGDNNFQKLKHLTEEQKTLILASLLGDGHVTDQGIFIVSHCESQKEYLYWKYGILRDCCRKGPKMYPSTTKIINGKPSLVQAHYRIHTRKIEEIKSLTSISKTFIIEHMNDTGFSIWILDDGYRDKYTWDLCVASLTNSELEALRCYCKKKKLKYTFRVDPRYIRFNCESTRKIDEMIKRSIPNQLDVVRKKLRLEVM